MKKLIKIYEHKKIMLNEEIKDILKIVHLDYVDVEDNIITLDTFLNGKKIKKISKDFNDISEEDYIYEEVNSDMFRLGEDELSGEQVLEKAKEILLNMYYEVYKENDNILFIKETFDKKIKSEYNISLIPSLNNKIDSLIKNATGSNQILLDKNIMSQILDNKLPFNAPSGNEQIDKDKLENYNIKKLYSDLKQIIFGQDEQLKIFLANMIKNISLESLYDDLDEIKRLKNNLLLIGPTGTGKTLMVESLAAKLNVPYIICDAKRYTSNGYAGEDVESILVNLYNICNEDMDRFEKGIIFIDEFDKLCEIKDEKSHVNTTDVQESILKFLDGTQIHKIVRRGMMEQHLSFDTSKITFVLSGAFSEMFDNETIITEETLKKYGMLPELVGRIGSKIILNKPIKEDLKNALINGKYSYLNLFNEYLEKINIDYEIDDEFIDIIVDMAYEMNLGYRGLEKAISAYVDEHLYDIISGDTKKLVYKINTKKD